jgi:hypothetical protein
MAVFPDNMQNESGQKISSFDQILDNLLLNKKALANHTLFPTEQAEVKPDELFESIFGFEMEGIPDKLTIKEIDRLNPSLFEASIAALYKEQGFDVYLTPFSNDKGADVVVLGNNDNYLIQVKQSRSQVGRDAVQEIFTSRNYYEGRFNVQFKLMAISNNHYTSTAELLATTNSVGLINRDTLTQMLIANPITIKDINRIESQRLGSI